MPPRALPLVSLLHANPRLVSGKLPLHPPSAQVMHTVYDSNLRKQLFAELQQLRPKLQVSKLGELIAGFLSPHTRVRANCTCMHAHPTTHQPTNRPPLPQASPCAYILRMFEVLYQKDDDRLYIVLEYCDAGSLDHMIRRWVCLSLCVCVCVCVCVCARVSREHVFSLSLPPLRTPHHILLLSFYF